MWSGLIDYLERKQGFVDQLCSLSVGEFHAKGGRIYCEKGCSACCSLNVRCTFTEAVHIAQHLNAHQRAAISKHVRHLQEIERSSADIKSFLYACRAQAGSCPLLDGAGACSIYPMRPLACRALLSTMEPHYCGLDFSTLSSEQKQAFMDHLDRDAVNFPTHYLAMPQHIARAAEMDVAQQLRKACGFSLSGSLAYLVELELEHDLSTRMSAGAALADVEMLLEAQHSFLFEIQCDTSGVE